MIFRTRKYSSISWKKDLKAFGLYTAQRVKLLSRNSELRGGSHQPSHSYTPLSNFLTQVFSYSEFICN